MREQRNNDLTECLLLLLVATRHAQNAHARTHSQRKIKWEKTRIRANGIVGGITAYLLPNSMHTIIQQKKGVPDVILHTYTSCRQCTQLLTLEVVEHSRRTYRIFDTNKYIQNTLIVCGGGGKDTLFRLHLPASEMSCIYASNEPECKWP